jgi:hypothetical protein
MFNAQYSTFKEKLKASILSWLNDLCSGEVAQCRQSPTMVSFEVREPLIPFFT